MLQNPTQRWMLAPLLCISLFWSAASSRDDGGSWAVEEPTATPQVSNPYGQPVQSQADDQRASRPRQPIQHHLPTTHVSPQLFWQVRMIGPDQY